MGVGTTGEGRVDVRPVTSGTLKDSEGRTTVKRQNWCVHKLRNADGGSMGLVECTLFRNTIMFLTTTDCRGQCLVRRRMTKEVDESGTRFD